MDASTTRYAAFGETVVFLGHFNDVAGQCQQGKVAYPLDGILLLCLLAVRAAAGCFTMSLL